MYTYILVSFIGNEVVCYLSQTPLSHHSTCARLYIFNKHSYRTLLAHAATGAFSEPARGPLGLLAGSACCQ